jgi:hypothetical protein
LFWFLDFAGTDSNPFSLDALAVFMYRVLQRVNHPVCSPLLQICNCHSYIHCEMPNILLIFNLKGKSGQGIAQRGLCFANVLSPISWQGMYMSCKPVSSSLNSPNHPYSQFQSRREFENELYERFGSLVKMPLLKPDRLEIFLNCFIPFFFQKYPGSQIELCN